ncbi:MAG: acetyl-CoA carboxylase carboxyltransferase subunit beta [Actinobacteria bacterium]|nr:acetyl-CoA carboxylase carboxyltransferase subunit beta [Actinomycetota bacterium]
MNVDIEGKTNSNKEEAADSDRTVVAAGLWRKCKECGRLVYRVDLEENCYVCPYCDHHFRISVFKRLEMLVDPDSFERSSSRLLPSDPLSFVDSRSYPERLEESRSVSGLEEAVLWGTADIGGTHVVIALMEFDFMGGSMGSVVGEIIARCALEAADLGIPLVITCASGGARMQEGLFSLLQMAKTAAALGKLAEKKLPYISILTNPTTGGVAASFATLADVILAEMGALIGFAGPRVIEQTIRQQLPSGFQSAEFCLDRGMVDCVIHRTELREKVSRILKLLTKQESGLLTKSQQRVSIETKSASERETIDSTTGTGETVGLETVRSDETGADDESASRLSSERTPWEIVQLSRHNSRPRLLYYLEEIFDEFVELHGDRRFGDDRAIIGGTAYLEGIPIMLVGHNRGHGIYQLDSWNNNNGMPHPEGIRKAQRLFKMAEKFGLPVITLVDTPGAYPGVGAEERGQALAIAEIIQEMCFLKVPVLSAVIGEGGSGGALSISVANRLLVMEYATFSVITPEGCAAILWRDSSHAPVAASALKMTSRELFENGLADDVIPEPPGGAHKNPVEAASTLSEYLYKNLRELLLKDTTELLEQRYEKYASIGIYREET